MKNSLLKLAAACGIVTAVPLVLHAQNDSGLEWNHFGMDARLGFNVRGKFMNNGLIPAPAPPSAGSAINRNYSDGFVDVDSSGNYGGYTGNFGYNNSSQVNAAGTALSYHATTVNGTDSSRRDDPHPGFEFSYIRDVAHEKWGSWGFKFAFAYSRISLQDNQTQTGDVTDVTDSYSLLDPSLNKIIVPLAPYTGSYNGPGTLIGSSPTRSTTIVPGGALISGNRGINADLYEFHLGPSADIRLLKDVSLQLGGGLAVGVADSRFSFSETTTTAAGSISAFGTSHGTRGLVGAYAEADVVYRFWQSTSVFAGVEFQYLGSYQQGNSGRIAELDLDQAIFLKAGLQWGF